MVDTGKVLYVDLTSGLSHVEEIDAQGSLGLGGKVLGIWLLEHYLDPGVDPLAPENVVALTPSKLVAYGMSGTDRFGVFTKSPLTGIWLETYSGGSFAKTLCETGWDAVVISGAAPQPVHLHIDAEGARMLPASDLWGKDTFAVEAEILAKLDRRSSVLSIGVAGERLVRIASVMHEQAHTLGRGGLGAVFGSKMLKAVSATSPGPTKPQTQEQFAKTRKEISALAVDSPTATTYHTWGTPVMVALLNEAGTFPTDFFSKGAAPHRATLEVEHWAEWASVENLTCSPCPLRCRKHLTLTEGPEAGRELHGPEYETLYSFGGSCMVEHARDVAILNERCNMLGIDSISGGNLAAIAIKAKQLGLVDEGPDPGDVGAIGALLEAVATRSTPIGELLAQGMDDALAGLGMSDWSITSKRLDPAGYDPRRLKGMALSYAVNVRGACHLRATFYKAELGGILDGLDDDAYVQTYIDWEDRMLVMDGLTMCRFYRDLMTWNRIVSSVEQLNGEPVTREQLEQLSNETVTRIRRFNMACGITPADDTVAERFFREPTDKAPALDRAELERRVRIYWMKRGWGEDGMPPDTVPPGGMPHE
ncbi:MAG: aldehyde:ferredoxin oxidoreductase [Thermoleophilia bacterium]|nr:aldehyde:ferredoxin oxidoreductase [Thermoleophilia bacterium]